jgi:EAL domain-containing protein (putative c-di-GMP-specific phosphodiesterase class I)/GGDEF domain-containing protein
MNSILTKLSSILYESTLKVRLSLIALVIFLCLLGGLMVYFTGGTHHSYLHILYVPVIISGFSLGTLAGVSTGVFAGLILGPFMPESVLHNIYQGPETWLFRLTFFVLVGFMAGMAARITRSYLQVLEHRYQYDQVTFLPNYKGLEKIYLDSHTLTGVVAIKFHQLEEVQKAFGPLAVSSVQLLAKERILTLLEPSERLAHLSNDCFLVCIEGKRTPLQIANLLSRHLERTYQFGTIPFTIEAYFGVAGGNNLAELIRNALVVVDAGRASNTEISEHTADTVDISKRNIHILHELDQALKQDQLTLNYQPIIAFKDEALIGVEALARWSNPTLGRLSPLEFTQIAEKTLLINPYTKWLITTAVGHMAEWRTKGLTFMVSLNFSMKNLEDPSVIDVLMGALKEHSIPPENIEIEITETAIAHNIQHVADVLHALREKGIKVAIDDFGTGQSALGYLFELPVDIVKIDQSFVKAMLENSAAESIIRAAITLGHEMNLKVIAEGVETKEQFAHLKKLGCDYGQGYFISKPMPFELATTWLETKHV